MTGKHLGQVLHYLNRLAGVPPLRQATDRELLESFRGRRDEAAFAGLVQRHGPMVLAVCQRLLGNCHDAEDAFQAVFLVLARRAEAIRKGESVGSWLYGVASRVARRARAQDMRRRQRDHAAAEMPPTPGVDEASWQALKAVLDEELAELPEKYRAPLVLCYLEGKTHEQAAQELGWPKGSFSSRVARARELLRQRLQRRGVTVTAGLLATALAGESAAAVVPGLLLVATLQAAGPVVQGKALAAAVVSARVVELAEGALAAMVTSKSKLVLLTLGVMLLAITGLAGTASREQQPEAAPDRQQVSAKPEAALADADPLPNGALLRLGTLRFREDIVMHAVVFSADGRTLISARNDGRIRWRDLASGRVMRTMDGQDGSASIALSPDGKFLAGLGGHVLQLWQADTGRELRRIEITPKRAGNARAVRHGAAPLVFSPDSREIAGVVGQAIFTCEVATGQQRWVRDQHPVERLAYAADGRTLYAANGGRNEAGTIRAWEVRTGKEMSSQPIPVHRTERGLESTQPFGFSADGKLLAVDGWERVVQPLAGGGMSVSFKSMVRLIDTATGKEIRRLPPRFSVIYAVAFSPDGTWLAISGLDPDVVVYDLATGREKYTLAGAAGSLRPEASAMLAFSADSKKLAVADFSLRVWDLADGTELRAPRAAHQASVSAVGYAPDGRTIATASQDGMLALWDAVSGQQRFAVPGHDRRSVHGITFSPDGQRLAAYGTDSKVRVWDATSGRTLHELAVPMLTVPSGGMTNVLISLAFSPDNQTLAACGSDNQFRVWDLLTGKEILKRPLHPSRPPEKADADHHAWYLSRVNAVALSPDRRTAVVADSKAIYLLDTASGQELCKLPAGQVVQSFVFSPDSQTLVSAGWDKSVRLWEVVTGKEIAGTKVAEGVHALTISPDSRTLAVSMGFGDAGAIELLDVATLKERHRLRGHGSYVGALAFAPEGRTLASGQRDTTALIWNVGAERPVPTADLNEQELARLWDDLVADAARAHTAVWRLADSTAATALYLQKKLPAVPRVAPARLRQLLADLDHDQFAPREAAVKELTRLGSEAEPALRELLTKQPSLETRRRVEAILSTPPARQIDAPETLRRLRAIRVLEYLGHRDALQALAAGAPGAPETQAAQAARARLAPR